MAIALNKIKFWMKLVKTWNEFAAKPWEFSPGQKVMPVEGKRNLEKSPLSSREAYPSPSGWRSARGFPVLIYTIQLI
jgi:hypothetical protein